MTTEQSLDRALNAAFPDDDQGHPQTDLTRRVAGIMAHVQDNLTEAGFNVEFYNFHHDGKRISFNEKNIENDDSFWVAARCISLKDLQNNPDATLIMNATRYSLMDLRGEIISYKKADDEP